MLHLLPLLRRHPKLRHFRLLDPPALRPLRHFLPVTQLVQRHVAATPVLRRRGLLRLAFPLGVLFHLPLLVIVILDVRHRGGVVILGELLEVFHELVLRAVEVGYALDFGEPSFEGGFDFGVGVKVGGVDDAVFSEVGGSSSAAGCDGRRSGGAFVMALFENFTFVVRKGGGRVGCGIVVMLLLLLFVAFVTAVATAIPRPFTVVSSGFLLVFFAALLTVPFVMMMMSFLSIFGGTFMVMLFTTAASFSGSGSARARRAAAATTAAMVVAAAAATALFLVFFVTATPTAAVSVSGIIVVIVLGSGSRSRPRV
mmetsp:Transcript_24535/g.53077  ORF Transcript_24535/g.53077 Transcript_24535/m.53077 type:complete len:312 (+) Transcript_24535:150-1085(+)